MELAATRQWIGELEVEAGPWGEGEVAEVLEELLLKVGSFGQLPS